MSFRADSNLPDERLDPPWWSDRFYILALLRSCLESVANKYLSKHPSGTLVDFGCGQMPYRPLLAPYIARYIGVDLPGNEMAEVTVSSPSHTELQEAIADVVLSTQVLEHVDKPQEYLEECNRLLKPDGLLILSTHGYWMYHPVPRDLWRWTGDGLRVILADSGFQVVEFEGLLGLGGTGLLLFQDAVLARLPHLLKPVLASVMQVLIRVADHLNSRRQKQKDACIYLAVARKITGNV